MLDDTLYWLNLCQYDIDTAYAMFEAKRYLYVEMMCQQIIEKAFKAVITEKTGKEPPKTHNLNRLKNEAELDTELTEDQNNFIAKLNVMNVESRYPTQDLLNKEFDENEYIDLLRETGELYKWIKEKL